VQWYLYNRLSTVDDRLSRGGFSINSIANHQSLAKEVADFLRRELLISAKYPQGTFIREEELARELNISRAPVREALKELEGQGLVRSIPRKGSMVLGFSPEDVEELYDIRFALETQVFEALVKERLLSDDDCERMNSLFNDLLAVASSSMEKDEKVIAFSRIDLEFHLFIAERSGRPWTIRILRSVYFQLQQAMVQYLESEEELAYSAREHLKIIRSLKEGDLDALRESRRYSYFQRRLRKREKVEASGI
jgi:DNA-binding GntR family transcriptional regulator